MDSTYLYENFTETEESLNFTDAASDPYPGIAMFSSGTPGDIKYDPVELYVCFDNIT